MHELRRYNVLALAAFGLRRGAFVSRVWRPVEVGGILDYAAEAKDGELPEIVKPTEEFSEEVSWVCLCALAASGFPPPRRLSERR